MMAELCGVDVPACVARTFLGNPLYSTVRLWETEENLFCQVEMSDVIGKDFGQLSLESLSERRKNRINILSGRHMINGVVC